MSKRGAMATAAVCVCAPLPIVVWFTSSPSLVAGGCCDDRLNPPLVRYGQIVKSGSTVRTNRPRIGVSAESSVLRFATGRAERRVAVPVLPRASEIDLH